MSDDRVTGTGRTSGDPEAQSPVADGLQRIRRMIYARGDGMGAVRALADKMDEPYEQLCTAISPSNIDRIRRIEKHLADA